MRKNAWEKWGRNFGILAHTQKVTATATAANNTSVDLGAEVFPPRKRNYHLEIGNGINHHDPEARLRGRQIYRSSWLCRAFCRSSEVGQTLFAEGWVVRSCTWQVRLQNGLPRVCSCVLAGLVCKMQQVELVKARPLFVPNVPSFMYDSKHIVNAKPGEER